MGSRCTVQPVSRWRSQEACIVEELRSEVRALREALRRANAVLAGLNAPLAQSRAPYGPFGEGGRHPSMACLSRGPEKPSSRTIPTENDVDMAWRDIDVCVALIMRSLTLNQEDEKCPF